MSLGHGASIVKNGLRVHLDAANLKSYPNLTNLIAQDKVFNNGYWTVNNGLIFNSTTEIAPDLTATATTITDDSSSNYEFLSRSISIPNDSQVYTLSIYVRKTTGGTAPGFAINSRIRTGGTEIIAFPRLNTDTGSVSGASVVSSGNYWKLYWTLANNNSGNTELNIDIYPAARLPGTTTDTPTATGSATIWGMTVTTGGNTWYDLSGNGVNGTFINGPNFDISNKGGIIFDGVNDYCRFTFSNKGIFVKPGTTICAMVYRTKSVTSQTNVISYRFGSGGLLYIGSSNNQIFSYYNSLSTQGYTTGLFPLNQYAYLTVRLNDDGSITHMTNGANKFTSPIRTGYNTAEKTEFRFSSDLEYFGGRMFSFQHYDRELSDIEISQNFNALRGRYGI
jgi:hypothetical protein